MFNLFKKNNNEVINEINNEELKQKIKNMAIDILIKDNEINNVDEKNITINFKYLDKTNNGLQSMFIICIDSNNYYFNISNNEIQLLSDSMKPFFDI